MYRADFPCRDLDSVRLIVAGQTSVRGSQPWVAAVGALGGGTVELVCGGTLVSSQHVLTSANCVQVSGDTGHVTRDI